MFSKFQIVITSFFLTLCITQGARLSEEVNKYSFLINDIRNKCQKRDYKSALPLFDMWFKDSANSPIKTYVEEQQKLVSNTLKTFNSLQDVDGSELQGTVFPLNKKKASAEFIVAGILTYKTHLGSGFKKETIDIKQLPALSIYYLLKKLTPESYFLDTARILILDQEYSSAKNLLSKAKKSNIDISALFSPYKNWVATDEVLKFHKSLLSICENINKNQLSTVPSKLESIISKTEDNDFLKDLYSSSLAEIYSDYQTAFENRRQKELELYTNFPAIKGEITQIECLNYPGQQYEVYLPEKYDYKGETLLPILFTFHPGGKSLISKFKSTADELNIILIAHPPTRGNINWLKIKHGWYTLMRDIPRRIHFDPSRQFVSGNSGGGYFSYPFSRTFSHKISGLIPMGGWLARQHDPVHDWYRQGLLIARTTGDDDPGKNYLWTDKEHLDKFNVVIKDWFHEKKTPSPTAIQKEVFKWLFSKRPASTNNDILKGKQFKDDCELKVSQGQVTDALNNCLQIIIHKPFTFEALEASKIFEMIIAHHTDDILQNYSAPKSLRDNLMAIDFIGNYLFMAALHGEDKAFLSGAHMLKHYTKVNHWRFDITWQMATSRYPKIRNNEEAAVILPTLELKDEVNSKTLRAAVYFGNGKLIEAEQLYEEIQKAVDTEKPHSTVMYKTLKRIMRK